MTGGSGIAGSGLFGVASLNTTQAAKSRAFLNHFNLNRVSRAWNEQDRRGNIFNLAQRNQWSLYYGSRYRFDQYNGTEMKK